MSFTPLDSGIVTSTLLKNGPDVVACWVLLLATCDRVGESSMQPTAAAGLLRISDERAKVAFAVLQAPDEDSRNKDYDGRRIIPLPEGSWTVVSHHKYQWLASKARASERQRKYEAKKKSREVTKEPDGGPPEMGIPPRAVLPILPPMPANPLIEGRRPKMESDGYRLIREISDLEPDRDPTEILIEAAGWKDRDGRTRTKVRLETMNDDHLIRTVHDLKSILEDVKRKHGTTAPAVQRQS
jgi:hypothetical protein